MNNWENPVFAPNKDILTNLQREIRNKGSFANLLSRLMPRRSDATSEIVPNYVPLLERKWSYLGQIFDRLGAMIPGKLIVINIGIDNEFNAFLSKLCETKGMIYLQNSLILTPDNQLGGKGHLNVTGHQHLANLIYSSIKIAGIIPQELE